eukprot:COSAG06_NODE_1145_length_10532_cov_16.966261_3_plen_183_part_00
MAARCEKCPFRPFWSYVVFKCRNRHFTKTRSGQTSGQLRKKAFFAGNAQPGRRSAAAVQVQVRWPAPQRDFYVFGDEDRPRSFPALLRGRRWKCGDRNCYSCAHRRVKCRSNEKIEKLIQARYLPSIGRHYRGKTYFQCWFALAPLYECMPRRSLDLPVHLLSSPCVCGQSVCCTALVRTYE